MQNKLLSFVLLLTGCLSVSTVLAQDPLGLEDIEKGWKTKTINNVANGSFGVMLERFDQTWPTWMVSSVRDAMEKGLSKVVLDEETALKVIIDAKNGYAEVIDAGTDGEYMSACYWNRPNGHKLLAVCLGDPVDPFIEFVCFYDYDPQKKALIPEPGILSDFRKWTVEKPYFCNLPKQGKNLILDEYNEKGHLRHIFTWNGTKPVFSKTEVVDDTDTGIVVKAKGAQPNIKDFVSAILSQEDTGEGFNGVRQSWDLYRNGMKQMPGDEIIVDVRNGYMGYESKDDESRHVVECCYWNCADGKHKLLAVSIDYFQDGKPVMTETTGVNFYMYDNATRKLKIAYGPELGLDLEIPSGCTGVTHELPRQGKTFVINSHMPSGKIARRFTWNGSKFVKEAPYQQEVMDIEEMPKTAERKDSHMQFAVYINKESAESEEGAFDAIYSVWLADERTGTVKKVCQTNPTAAPIWEQMKGKDPDAASTELQLIATAERAWIAPGDVSKVIVEGCPDGRNYWTYIIDTDAHTVKQLPSTEGVQDLDWNAKEIIVASYGYDDDGRYSFKRVYNLEGKFLRRTGEIERE